MDLEDFAAVRAIYDAGTFSAAAARLRVAQPALSRRIAKVERELGGRLFDRLPRRAAPTALGRSIAEAAARLEGERARVLDEARAIVGGTAGTVRMSSLPGGIPVLAKGLARFQEEHPDVWVEVRTLGADEGVEAMRRFEIDLATLPGSSVEPGLQARKLARWRVVLAVRPDHPFARRRRVTIEDLGDEPVLMLSSEFVVARHVVAAAARAGVRLRIRLADATPESVLSLARRGWGVGVVPDSVRLPRGVVAVPLSGQPRPPESDYVIAWPRGRTLPSAARELVDVLVQETAAFR